MWQLEKILQDKMLANGDLGVSPGGVRLEAVHNVPDGAWLKREQK